MTQAFIVLAYRQEHCVEAACLSALSQVCEPLEIIFSDDCSPDRTGEIMARLAAAYSGPHRVRFRRSDENRGLVRHLQDVVAETTSDLIIVQAGDDWSEAHRAAEIFSAWNQHGRPTSYLCSNFTGIDAEGQETEGDAVPGPFTLKRLASGTTGPLGGTCAFTRNLLTNFPPIPADVIYEDRVLPFRALLAGGEVIYIDKRLIRYSLVGGVSRNLPTSMADYLFRFSREYAAKTLPDARLRYEEAVAFKAPRSIKTKCFKFHQLIAAQRNMSDGRHLTFKMYQAMIDQAPFVPLLKHYLKAVALRGSARRFQDK